MAHAHASSPHDVARGALERMNIPVYHNPKCKEYMHV